MSKRAMDSIHSNTMHLVLIDFERSWAQVSTCRAESWKNLVTNAMLPGNGEAQTWKLLKQLKYCLSFWHVVAPQTNLENKSFSCKIVANLPMSHIRPFNWKKKCYCRLLCKFLLFLSLALWQGAGLIAEPFRSTQWQFFVALLWLSTYVFIRWPMPWHV